MSAVVRTAQRLLYLGRRCRRSLGKISARTKLRSGNVLRAAKDRLGFGSRFKLLRSFSLSSALVMALITALVVFVYKSHQTATLLRVAEDQNATLARSLRTLYGHAMRNFCVRSAIFRAMRYARGRRQQTLIGNCDRSPRACRSSR